LHETQPAIKVDKSSVRDGRDRPVHCFCESSILYTTEHYLSIKYFYPESKELISFNLEEVREKHILSPKQTA